MSFIEDIIPFIANMRKGISEGGDTPVVSLIPFNFGQEISNGDKFYLNTSLSEEYMDNFLNNLDYNVESNTLRMLLVSEDGDELLTAYNGEPFGFDSRFLIKDIDHIGSDTIYYSTKKVTDPYSGTTINKGWQPSIVENGGEITMELDEESSTLETVYEGEGWNGIIAGTKE